MGEAVKGGTLVWAVARLRSLWGHVLRWGWFYGCMLVGYVAQENYFPFSDWPMYSNFSNSATYVYAEDGNGKEVGWRTFGESSARVKRQYEREASRFRREEGLEREEAWVAGGEAILSRLAPRASRELLESFGGSLTLHYVNVHFVRPKEVEHEKRATATFSLAELLAESEVGEMVGEDGGADDGTADDGQGGSDGCCSRMQCEEAKEVLV